MVGFWVAVPFLFHSFLNILSKVWFLSDFRYYLHPCADGFLCLHKEPNIYSSYVDVNSRVVQPFIVHLSVSHGTGTIQIGWYKHVTCGRATQSSHSGALRALSRVPHVKRLFSVHLGCNVH